MDEELQTFYQQLMSEARGDADADGLIVVESFFEIVSGYLQEAGETESGTRAYFQGTFDRKALQVDGYGGDPCDSEGVLSLIICDFCSDAALQTKTASEVKPLFSKLVEFLRAARRSEFREQLEETSAGFGLADMISIRWKDVNKIKLILITNADSRAKVDAFPAGVIDEKPVTYNLWDIKRIRKFVEQGQAREDLKIDFLGEFGAGIPILRASGSEAALESYLAVIPGKQLAAIYDKWGARLLEANVRSFLQAKGGVNKGIRKTILEEPHMFLAYNNGIAATAEEIQVRQTEQGLEMISAENLQIVNGGQTTASIHASMKLAGDRLNDLYVQMKLNVVPKAIFEEVVPRISEYANSQNKVNAADFFANHPFHIRMQEFSRRLLAPAGESGHRETKWFYERARGQYADERAKLTEAQRKRFDAEYPKAQFFTKTDLAKFENSFACRPYIVSLGAQKNFADFAATIGTRWAETGPSFSENWFRRLIAKTIVFRKLEKLVSSADWYENGYRANIVTYAIAKIAHDAAERGMAVDLDKVWKLQAVPKELENALLIAGAEAQSVILNPAGSVRNLGEWAKKQACWKILSDRRLDYGPDNDKFLISLGDLWATDKVEHDDAEITAGILNQTRVLELGGQFWATLKVFGQKKRALSEKEVGILLICSQVPSKIPSERQSDLALKALKKLEALGFQVDES